MLDCTSKNTCIHSLTFYRLIPLGVAGDCIYIHASIIFKLWFWCDSCASSLRKTEQPYVVGPMWAALGAGWPSRTLWAAVQLHGSVSGQSERRYVLGMTNDSESDRYYLLCIRALLYLAFPSLSLYPPLICVCVRLLSWPQTRGTKHRKWADNKTSCTWTGVHASPHCSAKHKADVRRKIAFNNRVVYCYCLFFATIRLCFSLGIIVFINIYQCWSLLARIIVYLCCALPGGWWLSVCDFHCFISFSSLLYLQFYYSFDGWHCILAHCGPHGLYSINNTYPKY